MSPEDNEPNVLMCAAGGLGDAVLLAAVFDRFAAAAAGAPVTLILRQDAMGMAFLFRGRADVIGVDFGRFGRSFAYRRSILKRLKGLRPRLAVSLDYLRHPKLDERLVLDVGATETVAMAPRAWSKYHALLEKNCRRYTRLFDSGPNHLDKVVRWTNFANWLTGSEQPPPVLGAEAGADRGEEIILVPFSAVKEKQVPVEVYLKVIEEIGGRHPVVVAGAPSDPAKNPGFNALLDRPDVEFDGSGFQDLAPRLKRARLVISVDTAAMHLAVAMGAPTLCLASAAYVGEIVPYAPEITPPNARFVYTPMDCQGCLGTCILPAERGVFPCVARLDEEDIINRVRDSLSA